MLLRNNAGHPCASPSLDHLRADGEEEGGGREGKEERIKEDNFFQNAKT